MEFLLLFLIFTKGIKAKLNELESESDISPQNEGKDGKSELTPCSKGLNQLCIVEGAQATEILDETQLSAE